MPPKPAQAPPPVLETPPDEVVKTLQQLREGLDQSDIPAKSLDRNFLIATWNLRGFGELTHTWVSAADDSPKRNLADARAIAEILSRFDVVAIQEARANLAALRSVMKVLGPDWGLILTDVNPPPKGNGERLAFVFDTRRVKPSGLAAELVVPEQEVKARDIPTGALRDGEQFVRTPYAVSFLAGEQTFILTTLHVVYGHKPEDRIGELERIAQWLRAWADRTAEDYNQNLICLGDFNIDRQGDANYNAFTSQGLSPPPELQDLPRTIFDEPGKGHHYDQVAWFSAEGRAKLTLDYTGRGGSFDWTRYLLRDLDATEKSWHISDHYPLWCEFSMREG